MGALDEGRPPGCGSGDGASKRIESKRIEAKRMGGWYSERRGRLRGRWDGVGVGRGDCVEGLAGGMSGCMLGWGDAATVGRSVRELAADSLEGVEGRCLCLDGRVGFWRRELLVVRG